MEGSSVYKSILKKAFDIQRENMNENRRVIEQCRRRLKILGSLFAK